MKVLVPFLVPTNKGLVVDKDFYAVVRVLNVSLYYFFYEIRLFVDTASERTTDRRRIRIDNITTSNYK